MKNQILFFILLTLLVLSCSSARWHFEKQHYDRAIVLAARKLHKNPSDQKHIDIIVDAYRIANEEDLNAITVLQRENNDRNWEKIYQLYRRLENRQQIIKTLPTLYPTNPLTNVEFEIRDYSLEMANSRDKAAQNFYEEGIRCLQKGDRFSARQAYQYFLRAAEYNASIPNLQLNTQLAYDASFTRVLATVTNHSQRPIPVELESYLRSINIQQFNNNWVRYTWIDEKNIVYHYFAEIIITDTWAGPDRTNQTMYTETKTIEDGWEWEKNPDGSIRTDSLGNKIKKIIYREVSAKITKIEQIKDGIIRGVMKIYPSDGQTLLFNEPIVGSATFRNEYGFATGDNRALSNVSLQLLQQKPMPFPSDRDMIMMASQSFGNIVVDKFRATQNLIH
ncbi:MAG: hypothetical protein N2167_03885 [Flavobacteriales bacterium]|nr:hypothetical protein [Flavobacteriales bacterium]